MVVASQHSVPLGTFFYSFQGHLVGVVGRVGSGKTSVIAALTAEMQKKSGAVFVSGHDEGLGLVTQVSSQ